MNEQNDGPKQEAGCCGTGCSCGTSGSGGRWRWVVGIVVLLVAGVLVAKAVMKDNGTSAAPASDKFAALPTPDAAVKPAGTNGIEEISAIAELNTVAKDLDGVFVVCPDKTGVTAKATTEQIRSAVRAIESQQKAKVGVFVLKAGSRDLDQVATQITLPGALVMVKGRGMAPVSGEITEAKLLQAFVTASSAGGGCGPASGGCGPRGCN